MHTAVQFNKIEMSQFLIDFGVDPPECLTFDKETSLLIAASLGYSSMCESLNGNGANKHTPLHNANEYNHAEVLLTLLKCEASQHIKNDEGDKVLKLSLKTKNLNSFKTTMYYK